MIPRTIFPRKVLIIEGHLALWNEKLRKLYKRSYYLNLDYKMSIKRRKKFIDLVYETKVLSPMHEKYVTPTKKYGDLVLDVSNLSEDQVYKEIEKDLLKTVLDKFSSKIIPTLT
jgi:uridine kinase